MQTPKPTINLFRNCANVILVLLMLFSVSVEVAMAEVSGNQGSRGSSRPTQPRPQQPNVPAGWGANRNKKKKQGPDWLSMFGQGMSAQMGGDVIPYNEQTFRGSLGAQAGRFIQRQQQQSAINRDAAIQARNAWLTRQGQQTGALQPRRPQSIWEKAVEAVKKNLGGSTYVPPGGVPNEPEPTTQPEPGQPTQPTPPPSQVDNGPVAGGYHGHGSPTNNPYYWATYPMLMPPTTPPTGGGFGTRYKRRGGGGGYNPSPSNPWVSYLLGLNSWNI